MPSRLISKESLTAHCTMAVTPVRSFCWMRAPKLVQHNPSRSVSDRRDRPVPVGIDFERRIRRDEELVHRVRANLDVLVGGGQQDTDTAVGERVAERAAQLVARVLGQVVVVALDRQHRLPTSPVQRPRGAQVDRATDAAFDLGGVGGLVDIGPRNDLGGQHIECEFPAVPIGREQAAVHGHDAVFRTQAAHVDVLPFAATGPLDRDPGDVRQGIGHVVIGKAPEILGNDRVLHDRGIALQVARRDQRRTRADHDDLLELAGDRSGRWRGGAALLGLGSGSQGQRDRPGERKGSDVDDLSRLHGGPHRWVVGSRLHASRE